MNKEKLFVLAKQLTAGLLAVGMVMAGILVVPKQADAAVVDDKIVYDNTNYKIENYWSTKAAPVKEGYVFGGWYKSDNENDYMTATEAQAAVTNGTTAYAKFVPAQVLSVKAQNMAGTTADTEKTYVRVISSFDSKNYDKVGFDIWLANTVKLYKNNDTEAKQPLETDKIYDGLMIGDKKTTANSIFGGVSKYVSVWQLTEINKAHYGKIIYVRPYWITMDGTKVEGLAEYVHIEDEYMGYVSVPINILNKEDAAKLAAGRVNMTYTNANANETVALTFKEVEAGRLLPQMKAVQSDNVIKIVGNGTTVGEYKGAEINGAETLYANIRFQKPQDTMKTDVDVNFNIDMVQFCDWGETPVIIDEKWDVKYDAQ